MIQLNGARACISRVGHLTCLLLNTSEEFKLQTFYPDQMSTATESQNTGHMTFNP